MKKIPIIIDCDPGVDDSYAIALANSCEFFDIKAITPVEGNVPAALTRKNSLALREMLNIDCKVAFGADKPLVIPYFNKITGTHGEAGVGTVSFPPSTLAADEKEAWDVIYDEAVAANGELVLFAVGPLTNIATAFRKYPDLPKLLKKFVIMGGGTFGNVTASGETAEFNIWVDPTAAKEVFEKIDVYMVGLNATHAAELKKSDFEEMIALCGDNEKAYLLRELSLFSMANAFERGFDNAVIHDALAIASEINPDVLEYEDYYVFVEDDPEKKNAGQTVIDFEGKLGKAPNCHVAMKVNQPLFAQMMKDLCKYYGEM